ncbi:MAG: galactokinase [Ruminococcaceae bacterium]|nr:galactokinase [Oscillospiraceae bacterium]
MEINRLLNKLENDGFMPSFRLLYGFDEKILLRQKERYIEAVKSFSDIFPDRTEIGIFSAPGRTEIGGNHTDHQHGCVLAAAVNLDIIGIAAFHDEGVIRVRSEGYDAFEVSLSDLGVRDGKKDSSDIVRGIAAKFTDMGAAIGGFDLYATSDVLSGSGISSSAAFETLIGTIIDEQYNGGRAGAVEIAKIGQYAENVYFGKNSGLMDQMVSSVGGLVAIDFADTEKPVINGFKCDFEAQGCCLCITDTKGSHADLTEDYSFVRSEMEAVAAQFGESCLRPVDEQAFYERIPEIRLACSDRAVLRAAHFFSENRRAQDEAAALMNGDFDRFLEIVRESGDSSANLLQNLYSVSKPANQEIPLAIMASKRILKGRGAVRVHGGGFAGTIQAFVPLDTADEYIAEMDRIFGAGSCLKLRIRPVGGIEITGESEVS